MTAVIIAAAAAAGWLLTARWLYGRWRGESPGRRDCQRHGDWARRPRRLGGSGETGLTCAWGA